MGSLSLLQGIFSTQGLNTGLPHCRWILTQLSHQGSPRILEWVACPFSGDLPNPGIELRSSALQVDSSLSELPGKPNNIQKTVQFNYLGKDRDYILLSSTHKISFIIPFTDTDKGGVFQINSYISNSRNYFNVFHKNTISCGIAHNGIT